MKVHVIPDGFNQFNNGFTMFPWLSQKRDDPPCSGVNLMHLSHLLRSFLNVALLYTQRIYPKQTLLVIVAKVRKYRSEVAGDQELMALDDDRCSGF